MTTVTVDLSTLGVTAEVDQPGIAVGIPGPQGVPGGVGPAGPKGDPGIQGPVGPSLPDTGWRNVTANATNLHATTPGALRVRRIGQTVYMMGAALMLVAGSGAVPVYSLTAGFQPAGGYAGGQWWRSNSLASAQLFVIVGADMYWVGEQTVGSASTPTHPPIGVSGQFGFLSDQAFPSVLPGVPG